jgi:hypothetical protein
MNVEKKRSSRDACGHNNGEKEKTRNHERGTALDIEHLAESRPLFAPLSSGDDGGGVEFLQAN